MLRACLTGFVFAVLAYSPARADRLEPFPGAVYRDPLGHFTVAVPLGAMPCIRTSDHYGGRKTLMLFFGGQSPCPQAWDFKPDSPVTAGWYHHLGDYTVIQITATATRRLSRDRGVVKEWEWTSRRVAEANCIAGSGNTDYDVDSPFMFADLPGAACIGSDRGWSRWNGTFQRPWIDAQDADRDTRGRILPWVEYSVHFYGPNDGYKRHYRTLEQVFKSITLIPASPDATRNW
jgi:hypothetical protein